MPAQSGVLTELIKSKINEKIRGISGKGPLDILSNTSYFEELCKAVATGYVQGSVGSLSFTTQDTGSTGSPPVPGTGIGVGIKVDKNFMTESLYTSIRNNIISRFGSTSHDPYPPGGGNSGQYLKALCEGISEAVTEHYSSSWQLISTHTAVYSGTGIINNGNFKGLSVGKITNLILSNSPRLKGSFWPEMASELANGYVKAIHTRSTGKVTITGVCVPSMSQVCGISGSGSGQGNAV